MALVATHTGQAGEQIAAAVVVDQGFAGAGTVFVLVAEVQIAMHVLLALVVQLGYDEVLRLDAIHPVRQLINAVTLAFAVEQLSTTAPVASGSEKPRRYL